MLRWCYHRNNFACPGGEIGRHKGFKIPRLSSRAGSSPARGTISLQYVVYATLAQLVERNLAKVEVTSSNLVCRSKQKSPIRNGRAFCYLAYAKRANLVPKLVASLQTRKARSEMVGFFVIRHMRRGRTSCPAGRVVPNKESPIRNGWVFCYPAHAKRANLVPKLVASFQTRKARSEMVGFFAIWHLLSDMADWAFSALQLYGLRR